MESSQHQHPKRQELEPPPSLTRLLWLSCWVCVLFSGPVFGFGALQT
eukprot:COSAG02_NODE_33953_length_491_cov_1.844388_1_plen_46_part_10